MTVSGQVKMMVEDKFLARNVMMANKWMCLMLAGYFLFSCEFDSTYQEESEFSSWEQESAPLTEKEVRLIDSLRNTGLNVQINRRFIGREGAGNSTYRIKIYAETINVTPENMDSLNQLRLNLANKIYSWVIPDSVIYGISNLNITFEKLNYSSETSTSEFPFSKDYFKDSLAKWNGFKVVAKGKGTYKRVLIK